MENNGKLDMDTQESQMEKSTMGYAHTKQGASQSIVDALAVSCLCWPMSFYMHEFLTSKKIQLMSTENYSVKHMICFPNELPDMDEEAPWYETDDE